MAFKLLLPQTRFLRIPLRKNPRTSSPPQSSTTSYINHLPLYSSAPSFHNSTFPSNLCLRTSRTRRDWFVTTCINRTQVLIDDGSETSIENEDHVEEDSREQEGEDIMVGKVEKQELADQSIWRQMKEIVLFTRPATGLWICGPLMSLIDTAVIGQGSSIELAALGPATVVCDHMSFVFMFLSIATSNMVATALAKQDREEVQRHISVLLFVGLACGFVMLLFTRLFGAAALTAFTGSKNLHVVTAANTYVQTRGLAWPALLVVWVAQSARIVGTLVLGLFPNIFTPDQMVIQEMHKVLIPYLIALAVTPPTHSLEGTLLAGRDLRFISLSMSGCFTFSALVLLILSSRYGLQGCWFALIGFQWARFLNALQRLLSPNGMLYSDDFGQYKQQKLRTA